MLNRVERRELTRRRVLDAAAMVFEERGIGDSTVEQIAERAGYTRGAVYSNFRNKEDLALALVEERIARILSLVRPAGADPVDLSSGLATFAEHFAELFTGPIPRLFHELRALAIRRPDLRERIGELYEPLIDALSELLGRVSPALGDRRYAWGLAALANGISVETLANPELAEQPLLFGELAAAIVAGVEQSSESSSTADRAGSEPARRP